MKWFRNSDNREIATSQTKMDEAMKRRQPNNHDSLAAIRSRNRSNRRPGKAIPNIRDDGLFRKERGEKQSTGRIKTKQLKEREH